MFTATEANEATVSVSSIETDKLTTQVPVSGVDLLLNVPWRLGDLQDELFTIRF